MDMGKHPLCSKHLVYKCLQHHFVTFISDMFESSSFFRKASSVSNALTISLRYRSYSKPKFWKEMAWHHQTEFFTAKWAL